MQALLIRYTHVQRSDGHQLWVPLSSAPLVAARFPGNLYSKVQKLTLDGGAAVRRADRADRDDRAVTSKSRIRNG